MHLQDSIRIGGRGQKMRKIKACPFCGSEARLKQDTRYPRPECNPRDAFEVFCTNAACIIGYADDHYYLSAEEAIEAWNGRVSDENAR